MRTYAFALINLIMISSILITGCSNQSSASPDDTISIVHPVQNAKIGHQEIIKGKVSNQNAGVYVLIHPLSTNLWWVQNPPGAVNSNGTWQTLCYFGETNTGINEYFEIIAVTGAKNLTAGKTLQSLPSNLVRSDIITVQRTH